MSTPTPNEPIPTLWVIRLFGPISLTDLCERTGQRSESVHALVNEFCQRKLATRLNADLGAVYDITEHGKAYVAKQMKDVAEIRRLREIAPRPDCVGVSATEGGRS